MLPSSLLVSVHSITFSYMKWIMIAAVLANIALLALLVWLFLDVEVTFTRDDRPRKQ